MPRSLFHLSIGVSMLLSVALAREALLRIGLMDGPSLSGFGLQSARGEGDPAAVLLLAGCGLGVALASLFIRIATFTASRSLFSSYFIVFSVACTTLCASIAGAVHFRNGGENSTNGGAEMLAAVSSDLLAMFVALTIFSIHSYFHLQMSRALAAMSCLPLAAYVTVAVLSADLRASHPILDTADFAYHGSLAIVFMAIATHAWRHRVLFLESMQIRPSDERSGEPLIAHPAAR